MKEITLRVPDQKFDMFMEFIQELGLEVAPDMREIPEEHQKIVLERLKTLKEEDVISWESARSSFRFKEG
ncbi:MAG: hypothetical protein AAFW89_00505 [Bacteroidota bacterium]